MDSPEGLEGREVIKGITRANLFMGFLLWLLLRLDFTCSMKWFLWEEKKIIKSKACGKYRLRRENKINCFNSYANDMGIIFHFSA